MPRGARRPRCAALPKCWKTTRCQKTSWICMKRPFCTHTLCLLLIWQNTLVFTHSCVHTWYASLVCFDMFLVYTVFFFILLRHLVYTCVDTARRKKRRVRSGRGRQPLSTRSCRKTRRASSCPTLKTRFSSSRSPICILSTSTIPKQALCLQARRESTIHIVRMQHMIPAQDPKQCETNKHSIIRYSIYDALRLILFVWYTLYGVLYVILSTWYSIYDALYLILFIWYPIYTYGILYMITCFLKENVSLYNAQTHNITWNC